MPPCTATASAARASAAVPQTASNVAQVAYDVTVSLIDLVVTLSGPDDLNLPEGGWATLTAVANRPVEERTVFELIQTAGTASPPTTRSSNPSRSRAASKSPR